MKETALDRQRVLAEMMALAAGRANDAVKLAYLSQERVEEIDGLDLTCLAEFKRSGNGAVEVKLADRAAVLGKLLEQMKEEGALAEDLRQTAAALLRIGGDSFTLAAMNDTIRGCGLPARVEETGDPLKVKVVFPETAGIPAGFSAVQDRIEEILPCHLQVEYQFGEEA